MATCVVCCCHRLLATYPYWFHFIHFCCSSNSCRFCSCCYDNVDIADNLFDANVCTWTYLAAIRTPFPVQPEALDYLFFVSIMPHVFRDFIPTTPRAILCLSSSVLQQKFSHCFTRLFCGRLTKKWAPWTLILIYSSGLWICVLNGALKFSFYFSRNGKRI